MLGWLHKERGVPLAELRLRHALPSAERSGVSVAFDYIEWLNSERGVSVFTQGRQLLVTMNTCPPKHLQVGKDMGILSHAAYYVTAVILQTLQPLTLSAGHVHVH